MNAHMLTKLLSVEANLSNFTTNHELKQCQYLYSSFWYCLRDMVFGNAQWVPSKNFVSFHMSTEQPDHHHAVTDLHRQSSLSSDQPNKRMCLSWLNGEVAQYVWVRPSATFLEQERVVDVLCGMFVQPVSAKDVE